MSLNVPSQWSLQIWYPMCLPTPSSKRGECWCPISFWAEQHRIFTGWGYKYQILSTDSLEVHPHHAHKSIGLCHMSSTIWCYRKQVALDIKSLCRQLQMNPEQKQQSVWTVYVKRSYTMFYFLYRIL